MEISNKIRKNFPHLSTLHNQSRANLFAGRDLPAFMQAYLLMRFTIGDTGVIDEEGLKEYLSTKMTNDAGAVKKKLKDDGDKVNLTCRFYLKSDLQEDVTAFTIPDIDLEANAYILQSIVDKNKDSLVEGENWGNITLQYVGKQGKRKGYVNMIEYRPFRPFPTVNLEYYANARKAFSLIEWVDVLIASMGYNPDAFIGNDDDDALNRKLEFCSRFLIAVEPRVNMIELGPKGTGKSYCYINNSKYWWLHVNGGTTRAEMFYNRLTKQYGPLKTHDALGIDEVTTFDIKDNEARSMLKGYLEAGKAAIGKVTFTSNCGICLLGNIPLSNQMLPYNTDYYRYLPGIFRESALMDRFHGFIQGWKIPRLSVGAIYEGWALNMEYLSEIMHVLRTEPEYGKLFDEIVKYDKDADLRDIKAVKKLATAYAKLLFPHIKNLESLSEIERQEFVDMYEKYCLAPAVEKRSIVRMQCHLLDKEFQAEMPRLCVSSNLEDSNVEQCSEHELAEHVESIYVHSIFISEGQFPNDEKEHRMKLLEDAEEWIEGQAAKCGKMIRFVNGTSGLEGDAIYAPIPDDIDSPNYSSIDVNTYLELIEEQFDIEKLVSVGKDADCSKVAVLIIADGKGRSFATHRTGELDFIGEAVIYEPHNSELQAGVFVHEMLHLFGADDLYHPQQPEENVEFIKEHYPGEVMLGGHVPTESLALSPYTLWRMGWTDEREEWFDAFVTEANQ